MPDKTAGTGVFSVKLTEDQYARIYRTLKELTGISLSTGKEELVKARLMKRLRALKLPDFDAYLAYVERDETRRELAMMVDALTTNKTSFFREPEHFEYLRRFVLPELAGGPVRIWSAGCSSGEEPYTIAMVLMEELGEGGCRRARILATDISEKVLGKARAAVYDEAALRDVPPMMVAKYFTCVEAKPPRLYRVNDAVREMVKVAKLNLIGPWPMSGPFHVIFCRNVMIYFEKAIQQELVRRFWDMLEPGGYLFVGHAESLVAASHPFRYVRPAVYLKDTT
ncbi:MAG: CheR family methyltransferase [Armatimonadota bacterium]